MIPPSFRPAVCCGTCDFYKGTYCIKHGFPTTAVMVCDEHPRGGDKQ